MVDSANARKIRGAFFTPEDLADFVSQWAVRSSEDSILEPSCGEAAFLTSVGQRLRSLGAGTGLSTQLQGIEIHEGSAKSASELLARQGLSADIRIGNFFDLPGTRSLDAVVGNPPYVRYQSFSGEARRKAQAIALQQGVRLDGLASSWAAFVVHAASFLKPEGRLGLVLPAELLTVNYAGPVRRFLMQRFAKVRLVLFENLVFPGVLEEVLLLLAEGKGPTDHCEVCQAKDLTSLRDLKGANWSPRNPEQKWIDGLLPPEAAVLHEQLRSSASFSALLEWGKAELGAVTGNNKYFTLSRETVSRLQLPERELLRICPPSSRHLRGLSFPDASWQEMAEAGDRAYLFFPDPKRPSMAARRYIQEGEEQGVDQAYKCRVRSPWWRVPLARVPDLFLTYMNHDTPRLVANEARVLHLNSVHGVTLQGDRRQIGQDLLPIGMLNSLTLLGAELVGRSYGGGILKIEPKEAGRLPVPSLQTLERIATKLRTLRHSAGRTLRNAELMEVVDQVDRLLLVQHLGLGRDQIACLRQARQTLFGRRNARAAKTP